MPPFHVDWAKANGAKRRAASTVSMIRFILLPSLKVLLPKAADKKHPDLSVTTCLVVLPGYDRAKGAVALGLKWAACYMR
ncbi:MAG: hypothetical protein BroJett014_08500 [Planctomycetota bacterium]|nr:MAG: hypothetical protein BroJett014_08500 [Planctomycetota bacterium]